MTLYSVILFVHIASALAMVGCLSLEALSLIRLRRASTLAETQLWLQPVGRLPAVAVGSLVVILASGIYLAAQFSGFRLGWVDVALAAFLLMGPLGAVSGRRMRDIRHRSAEANATLSRVRELLRNPFLFVSLGVRVAVFLGIVLLMTGKPDLPVSLGVVLVSVALGFAGAFLIPRKNPDLQTQ
jgi:hypothetical protein